MKRNAALVAIALGGVLFLFDQWLKRQATGGWSEPYLLAPWFGWQPFFNTGVAFSLPLPPSVAVVVGAVVLGVASVLWLRAWRRGTDGFVELLALTLFMFGALSNLIDRVLYNHTIDFLRIFTGVINVADLLIIAGVVLYAFTERLKNTKEDVCSSS